MARPRNDVPTYRRHKQSGQAVVTLTDPFGGRRDVLLGTFKSKQSRIEYARVIQEWEVNDRRIPAGAPADLTIAELAAAFWTHVEEHYRRPDGTQTTEVHEYRMTLRPLKHLYGHTPANAFGPLALKAVRQVMVEGYQHPKHGPQPALARGVVNKRVARVRRMFRWAVENEMLPAGALHALQAVAGLQRGRCEARESEPVRPILRAVADATLPLFTPMVADMVRLQLETGMRPGELVTMRAPDLDMGGAVWLYRPAQHKNQHRGHERVIAVGPKGQEIIRRWLTTNLAAYLFSPRRNEEDRNARRHDARKTPLYPSHVKHQAAKKKRRGRPKHGDHYCVTAYARAIARAIQRHNEGKPEGEHLPHWHPHQLRHTRALELKREFGLDVARAVLGHRSPIITEHYAGLDTAKAAEVMATRG
jgi:integrase